MQKNKVYILKNGLTLIFYQDTSKHYAYAEIIVKYGGSNNSFTLNDKEYHVNDGIAHLIEHLLLEHSIYGNLMEDFSNNYVKSNGMTSFKSTKFYIRTVINFYENLEKLIKSINIPSFTIDDMNVTKLPIYEEIRRDNDNDFRFLNKAKIEGLYNNATFKSVLGTEEELRNIDYEILKKCYDVFYQPSNQIIAIAGNVDIKKTIALIENLYNEIDKPIINCNIPKLVEPNNVARQNIDIYRDIEEEFVSINYKINISSFTPYDKVKLSFYMDYFLAYNFNEASDTYKKLIDDKISVESIHYNCNYVDDFLIVSIETYTNKYDEFFNLINNKIKGKKANIDNFNIMRKSALISLILREEGPMNVLGPFIDNIVTMNYNKIDKIKDIENQTYDDFINIINSLEFNNYCIIKMVKKNIVV